MVDASKWGCGEVGQWLRDNGFQAYESLICSSHRIDGNSLLLLTEADLKSDLGISALGDRKRLAICIQKLQIKNGANLNGLRMPNDEYATENDAEDTRLTDTVSEHTMLIPEPVCEDKVSVETVDQPYLAPGELLKVTLAFAYMAAAQMTNALVIVLVDARVPDKDHYPPLPDVVLDNIPSIPWAFTVTEVTALLLGVIWLMVVVFHKYRLVLLRRMFYIIGCTYFLRCLTLYVTSLSVVNSTLTCSNMGNEDIRVRMRKAFIIWRGFGMALLGTQSCGDYLFSGHTVIVTLLNLFITEYTPPKLCVLHIFTWIMTIGSMVFILLGHMHYSVDVVIGFYTAAVIFLYYHSLANNRLLLQERNPRIRIWFPFFTYFESNSDGPIPFAYKLPFSHNAKSESSKCSLISDCVRCLPRMVHCIKSRFCKNKRTA